jgi:hypothetical protein
MLLLGIVVGADLKICMSPFECRRIPVKSSNPEKDEHPHLLLQTDTTPIDQYLVVGVGWIVAFLRIEVHGRLQVRIHGA